MEIGKFKLHAINSGLFSLDGGAMFGIVPKPLWQKTNPADDANRIKLATRNLLLQAGKRNILIDTGMGDKWDEKSMNIYDINQIDFSLSAELSKLNLRPEDITDVILTHLHFDHTGGSTKMENGRLRPFFPNAVYYVQRRNYEWAVSPSEKDKGSYIKENFVPLLEEGVLKLIGEEEHIDDGIDLLTVNGHTFGQQLVKISDPSVTLLYCCDLFPTASHIPLPYIMGYDLQPLITLEEKKKILAEAAEKNWLLFFEHDPETVKATVEKTEKGYKINGKFQSL